MTRASALVWFRRDLRCYDHAALHHALREFEHVYCAFVFDTDILSALPSRADRRVEFIHASLVELDHALDALAKAQGGSGAGLITRHGRATDCIPRLARELGVTLVLVNRDYEPAAVARDGEVARQLERDGIRFVDFKDQVIFDGDEILTRSGTPFSVFTPYRNAWLHSFQASPASPYAVAEFGGHLAAKPPGEVVMSLADIGFSPTDPVQRQLAPGMSGGNRLFDDFRKRIDEYKQARDFPARKGVSCLSTHLRFGTVSIRKLATFAWNHGGEGASTWLSELIWREFYQMILARRPDVVNHCFRPECDAIVWDDRPDLFAAWCEARTGYPLVDAAMRQLNLTGYMHNRLRMVVASFLTKDLGIDWRLGERHFADHLNDYDLAANNGGWQWAASTGCDAQPWFRIFNPVTQSERFDPAGQFIRRHVPELARVPDRFVHAPWKLDSAAQQAAACRIGIDYPAPVVDHPVARQRTLDRFGRLHSGKA